MHRLEEMTWVEIDRAVEENRPLIFILGSIEQHGPHLPVGTDMFIPCGVMERVAEKTGAILAPAVPYGFRSKPQSGGGESFQGTFSLSGKTVINLIRDLMVAFIKKGFTKIFILNWHYENVEFVHEGIVLAMDETGNRARIAVLDNPNALVDQTILDQLFKAGFPGWEREHAAIFETSMMMAVRPDLVRRDLIRSDEPEIVLPYSVYPTPAGTVPASGVLWHAAEASEEQGIAACASMVDAIAEIITKEFPLEKADD
ncbi:MAG: creatininase [Planctomycetes bacterium]|nr:creatininase [Planctomycetota bacterium]